MVTTENEITKCPHCGFDVIDATYDGRRVKQCTFRRCLCAWNIHGGKYWEPIEGDQN
jgi:hypothetical protein